LNPHETELNPHKAAEAASRHQDRSSGAFRRTSSARRHGGWQKRSVYAARDPLRP
jgi:hypothetical protein